MKLESLGRLLVEAKSSGRSIERRSNACGPATSVEWTQQFDNRTYDIHLYTYRLVKKITYYRVIKNPDGDAYLSVRDAPFGEWEPDCPHILLKDFSVESED